MTIPRPWQPEDDERLVDMIRDGLSAVKIAAALGRGINATYDRAAKHGGFDLLRSGPIATRNAQEVALLFGVPHPVVCKWIAAKYLKARRNKSRHQSRFGHYLIHDDALLDFLDRRETWMDYTPEQIADPDWCEAARAARAKQPGRWLTPGEVALQTGYDSSAVHKWIRKKQIPALRRVRIYFVWSADLAVFTPPGKLRSIGAKKQQRIRGQQRRETASERQRRVLALLRAGMQKWEEVGEALDMSPSTCRIIYRRWEARQKAVQQ